MIGMKAVLDTCLERDAQEIRLLVGRRPAIGDEDTCEEINSELLTSPDTKRLMREVTPPRYQGLLGSAGSANFFYVYDDDSRFRVALREEGGEVSILMRPVPDAPRSVCGAEDKSMKCQECGSDAVLDVTRLVEGVPQDLRLCKEHAKRYFAQRGLPDFRDWTLDADTPLILEVTQSEIDADVWRSFAIPGGKESKIKLGKGVVARRGLEEAQSKGAGRRTGTGYAVWRVRGELARDNEALHPHLGRAL